jgi:hypothetical protein
MFEIITLSCTTYPGMSAKVLLHHSLDLWTDYSVPQNQPPIYSEVKTLDVCG